MQLDAPTTCENCGMLYAKSIKICPDCGHEEVVPDKVEKQVEGIDSVLEPIRKIPPPNGEMIYKYVKGLGENIYKALKIMENQILELFVMYRVGQKQYLSNLNDGRLDKRLGQLIRPVYFTLIKKEDLIPEKGFKRKISTLIESVKSKLKKMYNIE